MPGGLVKVDQSLGGCACLHFSAHAKTAVFSSESDPVNRSANFSIYP